MNAFDWFEMTAVSVAPLVGYATVPIDFQTVKLVDHSAKASKCNGPLYGANSAAKYSGLGWGGNTAATAILGLTKASRRAITPPGGIGGGFTVGMGVEQPMSKTGIIRSHLM